MPDKEDPAAHLEGPDMNRYYYRPGTTEPELRPEFVEEERLAAEAKAQEEADAAEEKTAAKAEKPTAKKAARKK